MKILHTSDWHIGQFKGPVENGVNLRSQDTKNCLLHMVETAEKEKPDVVCISGDIFHQAQIGPVRLSDEIITAAHTIEDLSAIAKLVIVMRGTPNHDGSGQFRVLERMLKILDNVVVVMTPQVINTPLADFVVIPGFDKQEFRAKFPGLSSEEENLAWTKYISDMVLTFKAGCDPDKPSILMSHYTVPGCNMESGQTSFFTNFEPVIPREALQTADYDGVFLGHIHRPQQLSNLRNVFYAGAINTMNFNDEGQPRGFYIHEIFENGLMASNFYNTPYRKFKTIDWSEDDVKEYLTTHKMKLLPMQNDVADAIVRIRYSCTSEQKKAINIPLLQQELYELGAFYVSGIEAEHTIDITNRGLLSEESDPLANLKKWLDEKCYQDADRIVEMAEPIIADAMKQSSTSEIFGVLRPVSISAKNYRNYKDETFDFADVSFCSINGVNGAGKSSLFMDAIVDALYEETREGDNKAWIRGTEDARSGSIEFIFDIGEKRFRVTRTRMKSGRATLNLSQLADDGMEWLNLSKERIYDTQEEIERVLGMDSMTFRSCALIMQDQYGLFLQAKKDERIAILGNLLGLGIYGAMEQKARAKLAEEKKTLMAKKEQVKSKADFIASKGDPDAELEMLNGILKENEDAISTLNERRLMLQTTMANYETAKKNMERAKEEEKQLQVSMNNAHSEYIETKKVLESCNKVLQSAPHIREYVERYKENASLADSRKEDVVRYEAGLKTIDDLHNEIRRYENIINNSNIRNAQIEEEIKQSSCNLDIDEIEKKLAELDDLQAQKEELRKKQDECTLLMNELERTHTASLSKIAMIKSNIELLNHKLRNAQDSERYIADSGCPVTGAKCKFLIKAQTEVDSIEDIKSSIAGEEEKIRILEEEYEQERLRYEERISVIGYHASDVDAIVEKTRELSVYVSMKKQAEEAKLRIARLEAEKEANDKTIGSCNESLFTVKIRACRVEEDTAALKFAAEEYRKAKEMMELFERYLEEEKQIPVYEERKKHAHEKIDSLNKTIEDLCQRIDRNKDDLRTAKNELLKYSDGIEETLNYVELQIKEISSKNEHLQVTKGTLLQKAEDIKVLQEEIDTLNAEINIVAANVAHYDVLKNAFSQDGVPHQIVRNIIPHITDTANNILGQMTGGTMGVEFVMDRTVKGKDGDKATLDVLINEYGKTTLPYSSKSGGEKVKASLAVILALSEIKTSAAGIQLGMLFIDEPPFLDSDGAQAYVDSLETIRRRYPDVKIMAITHDEAMKARFDQCVTVVKTEDGSKVIY